MSLDFMTNDWLAGAVAKLQVTLPERAGATGIVQMNVTDGSSARSWHAAFVDGRITHAVMGVAEEVAVTVDVPLAVFVQFLDGRANLVKEVKDGAVKVGGNLEKLPLLAAVILSDEMTEGLVGLTPPQIRPAV